MEDNFCPHCGRPHSHTYGGNWQFITSMQSTASTPWQLPTNTGGYIEAWRRTPARTPGFVSDVGVPAGQAGLIALAAGVLSCLLPAYSAAFTWLTPVVISGLAFGVSTIALVRSHRSHLWSEEHITQGEKDNSPQLPDKPIELNVTHTNPKGQGKTVFRFELPDGFTEAKFYDFARGVTLGGKGIAQADWVGGLNKLCSKPKYQELLATLEKAGFVTWLDPDNHSVGRKLTTPGRRSLLTFVYSYEQRQAGRQAGNGGTNAGLPTPEGEEGDE